MDSSDSHMNHTITRFHSKQPTENTEHFDGQIIVVRENVTYSTKSLTP